MKKIFVHILFFSILLSGMVFASQAVFAQEQLPDFSAEIYREAIQNISDHSGGQLERDEVLRYLSNNNYGELFPEKSSRLRSDTIYVVPEIAFAAYDQNTISFAFYPVDTFFEDSVLVSFPEAPGWASLSSVDSTTSLIHISLTTNPDIAPRSTPVLVQGVINLHTVQFTAYILQAGKPQQFILVSPKYQAVAPQGGLSAPFSVTSFNVDSWTAVFTETWVHVDTASLTNQSITFNLDPNIGNISRDATIQIQDINDPDVQDDLTIFQFVDTSNYIIASPASGFINSGANAFSVNVNANILWQVEYIGVPAGMIADSVVGASNAIFNITENTSSSQRIANISLTGILYPEVSAQIQIVQSGIAPPYISVSPANSYVGSQAGSIILNVDANVNWETDIFNDPNNMLTLGAITQSSVSFEISANTGTTSRLAEGRLKRVGSPLPADTFRIVQEASFILINPAESLIPCEGDVFWAYLSRYNVDSITIDTSGFFGQLETFGNDSLKITIPANSGAFPRSDTLAVCSFENPAICQNLVVFQYACNQPYVVVTPKFHSLPYQGGTSDYFIVNTANIPDWEVYFAQPESWVTNTFINGDSLSFEIAANENPQARDITFLARSTSNPEIFDSAVVFQDGAPAPILLASPREQVLGFEENDSLDFMVTYQNIEGWEVEMAGFPDWIVIDSAGGHLLSLDVNSNNTSETRQALIKLFASNNPSVQDSVSVYQYAVNDAYILAAPRSDTISHLGNPDLRFKITTANVPAWEIDTLRLANWIHVNEPHNPDSLSLTIDPNPTAFAARFDTVWIQSVNQPDTSDFVVIYQYAAPESYLIAAPREQTVPWQGSSNLAFFVTSANVPVWTVDPLSVPEWININQAGGFILLMSVEQNDSLETRVASIRIFDPLQPDVQDSVKIYQYSHIDKYLIASPREKKFGQFGSEQTDFLVEKVNLASWEVETASLPAWVQLIAFGDDTLRLKILENTSFSTRHTSVNIFASNDPMVKDSVSIFQYAANDTLLLASPRQQLVQYFGDNALEFEITKQNADAWKVDPASVADWISINSQGGNLLSLTVDANPSLNFRSSTIVIYDTLNTAVRDSVSVYQLAAPASYILASPRADTVLYSGGQSTFLVTALDLVTDWIVDESTLPSWIPDYSKPNDSTLVFSVQANTSATTLQATIRILDEGNSATRDSISIYQYAAPEKYVLASPREQKIIHQGGILQFEITAVNVDTWGVDESTLPDWISDYSIAGNNLLLTIEPNDALETRSTNIRIYGDFETSMVQDFIQVYQYSGLDHYLLASPRERKTGNLSDTIYFRVDTVNISAWQAEVLGNASLWIETFISGADTLGLIISENTDTIARPGSVKIFSTEFPEAEDIVDIYQYSAYEPYLILDRSYETVSFQGGDIEVLFYSNLDSVMIEKGNQSQWYRISGDSISSYNDTIRLKIDINPEAYLARSAYIKVYSQGLSDTTLSVNFYFQQLINPNLNDIYFSGSIMVEQSGLENVNVIMGEDTVSSDMNGNYGKPLPYGWVGAITPLKSGYYFEPPNYVFEAPQKNDNDTVNFTAFPIIPKIAFNIAGDTLAICSGEQIDESSPDYPVIGVTGTFGPRFYKWFSVPEDPGLNTDSTSSPPTQVFSPEVTTIYYLVLYNYGTSDTTSFTLFVNPPPETHAIVGPKEVCQGQAGVIYSVSDFQPGEYFSWQLSREGNPIKNYSSNIAVIDWQNAPGNYTLTLNTYNIFGCSISNTDTIKVSADEAPPKAIVKKKEGDNMLLCVNADANVYDYAWGWYTLSPSGDLNSRYIIPERSDWYCRLPEGHNYNPSAYKYFVAVTFKNGQGCESVSFLDDNAPVGIPDQDDGSFTIYPNPTSGMIRLNFLNFNGNETLRCQIMNTAGQIVFSKSWDQISPAGEMIIEETEGLKPGVYFFRAQLGNKIYNSKFVVQ